MFKLTGVILGSFFIYLNTPYANEVLLGETKSVICSSCHGLSGNSSMPLTPNLAGQNASYIVSQLKAFKKGTRKNEAMEMISQSLSNDEMMALATYYSVQEPSIISGDISLLEKGKEKYVLCWTCHGENGEGPGSYPRIANQHSQYIVQQLKNFKNGYRVKPVMNAIVEELSSDDIEALGAYVASLNPPSGWVNIDVY